MKAAAAVVRAEVVECCTIEDVDFPVYDLELKLALKGNLVISERIQLLSRSEVCKRAGTEIIAFLGQQVRGPLPENQCWYGVGEFSVLEWSAELEKMLALTVDGGASNDQTRRSK